MYELLSDFTKAIQCLCRQQDGYTYLNCHDHIHAFYEEFLCDASDCQRDVHELRGLFVKHFLVTTQSVLDQTSASQILCLFEKIHANITKIKSGMQKFGNSTYDVQAHMYNTCMQIFGALLESNQQIQNIMLPGPDMQKKTMQLAYDALKTTNTKLLLDKCTNRRKYDEATKEILQMRERMQEMSTINTELTRANKELARQNVACQQMLEAIEDSNMCLRKKMQDVEAQLLRKPTQKHALGIDMPHLDGNSAGHTTRGKRTTKTFVISQDEDTTTP